MTAQNTISRELDLKKDVNTLCKEYPELVDIMVDLGFKPLGNPIARKMVGSHITIPQGSQMMNIPMERILFALAENNFSIKEGSYTVADAKKAESSRTQAGPSGLDPAISNVNEGESTVSAGSQPDDVNAIPPQTDPHEPGHTFLARMGKTRLRPGGKDATDWLLEHGDFNKDSKVLEVACNMCTTLIGVVQQYGCEATGLDLDQKALDHAAENIRKAGVEDKITLVQGSAFELPFPDNTFDVVINEAMLTMLLGDQKDQALAEYYRVLKPGGKLLTQDVLMRTDDTAEQQDIVAGISRAINVHVEPLTYEGWTDRFAAHHFATESKTGAMTLLDPEGMLRDEGEEGTMRILLHAMQSGNAGFFERMFNFFNSHKDQLGYIALAGTKQA